MCADRALPTGCCVDLLKPPPEADIKGAKDEIDDRTVTNKTNLLIVGDVNPNGSKYKNAMKHRTRIVPLVELIPQVYSGEQWAYPPRTQRKDKPVKVKPNKELNKALRAIPKEESLAGFVGF